jgi:hypothetical protein
MLAVFIVKACASTTVFRGTVPEILDPAVSARSSKVASSESELVEYSESDVSNPSDLVPFISRKRDFRGNIVRNEVEEKHEQEFGWTYILERDNGFYIPILSNLRLGLTSFRLLAFPSDLNADRAVAKIFNSLKSFSFFNKEKAVDQLYRILSKDVCKRTRQSRVVHKNIHFIFSKSILQQNFKVAAEKFTEFRNSNSHLTPEVLFANYELIAEKSLLQGIGFKASKPVRVETVLKQKSLQSRVRHRVEHAVNDLKEIEARLSGSKVVSLEIFNQIRSSVQKIEY